MKPLPGPKVVAHGLSWEGREGDYGLHRGEPFVLMQFPKAPLWRRILAWVWVY